MNFIPYINNVVISGHLACRLFLTQRKYYLFYNVIIITLMLFDIINDIVMPHFGMIGPTCIPVTTRIDRQTETEEMMNGRVETTSLRHKCSFH